MIRAIPIMIKKVRKLFSSSADQSQKGPSTLTSEVTPVALNTWQAVLVAPVDQLCEAPSADTVRYAYDLYVEETNAPFAEREARMAARLARIQAGFATLVARAPYLVEAAFTEHPQVFADMRRLPKRGRP